MQGFQLSTHAASCLILVLSSTMICTGVIIDGVTVDSGIMISEGGTTSPADLVTMNTTCQQYPGSGFIGNPGNCSSWGYCEGNVLTAVGSCGNYRYDILAGTCAYASSVKCINSAAATCEFITNPTYIADPNDCSQYVWCAGDGTSVSGFQCPANQYLDEVNQACTYANSCTPGNICRLVKNGVFLGDPDNCGSWIQCINGTIAKSGSCATGKYFNTVTGSCGSTNLCRSYPSDASQCSAYKTGTEYISDGETCYGYYYCSSTDGPGTWGKCPFATHFDETLQKCVSPVSTKCTNDRCGNLNLQFVADEGCTTYTYCKDEQSVKSGITCNNKGLFDEINQNCAAADDSVVAAYPICTA